MNTIAPVLDESPGRHTLSTTLQRVRELNDWLDTRVVGQPILTQRLIVALLCGGHLLVEGAPGLAKTRVVKELAKGVEGEFHRIQFTPDLLPSDVTGTEVFRPEDGTFYFQKGPIFHNLLLADEVNRAPAKGPIRATGRNGRTSGHPGTRDIRTSWSLSCNGHSEPD